MWDSHVRVGGFAGSNMEVRSNAFAQSPEANYLQFNSSGLQLWERDEPPHCDLHWCLSELASDLVIVGILRKRLAVDC